jgi:16S rRNA (guanine966-N2)-methyltransferase
VALQELAERPCTWRLAWAPAPPCVPTQLSPVGTLAIVRVVAGLARGRRLTAKLPAHVRPTTDLVREAIFSALTARGVLRDAVVADLYCGSGAMGIEALSRGAASCTFVDDDPACLAAARANLASVGLEDAAARFVRASLPRWRPSAHVDVALYDPPYGELDVAALLEGLDAALVVLESDRDVSAPQGWEASVGRRYGGTLVTMLQPTTSGVGQ